MGQTELIITFAFITVFSLAIFGYATGFANDNDAVVSINNDSVSSGVVTYMNDSVSSISTETNSTLTQFFQQATSEGSTAEKSTASFNFGQQFYNNVKEVWKFITSVIFGGDSNFALITRVFLSTLALIVLLYVWKTLRGGNPN